MELTSRTVWTLRRYWADRLGVVPDVFNEPGMTIALGDEGGIHLFNCDKALVLSAPHSRIDICEQQADALASLDTGDQDGILEWFNTLEFVNHVLGPAFYGYADRESFDTIPSAARVLTRSDKSAHDAFRAGVPDTEWEHGGAEFTPGETVGLYNNNELVATARYSVWDELIAHLAVVTHPDHRNQGYGRAVVSRATEQALSDSLIPQYRTLDAWP